MKLLHKIILTIIIIAAVTQAWFLYRQYGAVEQINLAASAKGDSFKMAQAIAEVVSNTHPKIHINLKATAGSVESMRLLDKGEVDLAMIQADTDASDNAQLVSLLYHDLFQFIVRKDSGIDKLSGLIGKKIAIAKQSSGQHKSFWSLVSHYEVKKSDIHAVSMTQAEADEAFVQSKIDAIFRIAPPGAQSIKALNNKVPIRLLAITQAEAIRLREPTLHGKFIPEGAYSGYPAVPEKNIPTLGADRLLVARNTTSNDTVRKITEVLFENRQELQERIKLAGFITQPDRVMGTVIPLHRGAIDFYDRQTPSFLRENAELIALFLTLLAIPFSGLMQLRKKSQRKLIKQYNNTLLEYIEKSQGIHDPEELEKMAKEVNDILIQVTHIRNNDKISAEDFELFAFILTMTRDEINEYFTHKNNKLTEKA